jgi:hypothetical protein
MDEKKKVCWQNGKGIQERKRKEKKRKMQAENGTANTKLDKFISYVRCEAFQAQEVY